MRRTNLLAAWLASAALCVSCSPTDGFDGPPPVQMPPTQSKAIAIRVLSSLPQHVSGGDARVAITAPKAELAELELWLDGTRVYLTQQVQTDTGLEGIIGGLKLGENYLEVRHSSRGREASVVMKNHPIIGPMFSGPQQEPFVCSVVTDLGKEPLVDTTDPKYYAVKDSGGKTIGYSKNCSIDSYVTYYYMPVGKFSHRDVKPAHRPSRNENGTDWGKRREKREDDPASTFGSQTIHCSF